MRKKMAGLLAALAPALALALGAVVGLGASPALAAGCPVGDGPANWGKAKLCPDAPGTVRFHLQDSLTDGYCVRVRWFNEDTGAWVWDGAAACTTGAWETFQGNGISKYCSGGGARLYKVGTNTWFTIPQTIGC